MRSPLLLVIVLVVAGCSEADPVASSAATAAPATTTSTSAPTTTTTSTTSTPAPTTTTSTTTTTQPPPELLGLSLEVAAEIDRVLAIAAPQGDGRVFLAQRAGTIHIIEADGLVRDEPFLDITDRVRAGGIEQGLLSLTFHPEYAANGRFFVYYTDANDDTVLAEFSVTGSASLADPGSERQILVLEQPTERHNGGMLEFGPDGFLYVAVGDGGDGGHNGQKPDTLLGTILRLDVDGETPYAVPAGNPFVAGGGAPEVWAYGLRNPWRVSIDEDHIYIADVGQSDLEEVTVLPLAAGGANLGWAYREGSACFNSPECEETDTVLPTVEYPHGEGCSITGGLVYRGEAIPELRGTYFYSDWCQGWVRSFRFAGGVATDQQEWSDLDPGQVNTFGTDGMGEIYIGTWGGGVLKLVPVRAEE
ncbi:MAG: PQQ-dependent sugar dehydrogenase [Acidimicrobiia bacterium]|nr:PQQ-dependent sugar dehydrogenase [Acidimicrobiia bacterium]